MLVSLREHLPMLTRQQPFLLLLLAHTQLKLLNLLIFHFLIVLNIGLLLKPARLKHRGNIIVLEVRQPIHMLVVDIVL